MRNHFTIKLFIGWLMAFLLAFSGAIPATAAVTSQDATIGPVSFLLQGVTGDLHLKEVRLAYQTSLPGSNDSTKDYFQNIPEPNAVLSPTDTGYLVTIPEVDWSVASTYDVLINTDQYIWASTISQTEANSGSKTLTTDQFVQISADVGDSVLSGFQLQKLVLPIGVFKIPVDPGQYVRQKQYIGALLFGYKDDAAYFADTYISFDNAGKLTNPLPFEPMTVDSTDPSLQLSGVGLRDDYTVEGWRYPSPQMYFWDPSSLPFKKVYLDGYFQDLLFAFSNAQGYRYLYSLGYTESIPFAYHFDGNLTLKTEPDRMFYHAGETLQVPSDLGLGVTDSQGHRVIGVYDSKGNPVPETVELARNSEFYSYDYNWDQNVNTLTLPQDAGDFTLTYKFPTGSNSHLQTMTTLSLTDGTLTPQLLPFKDDTDELIGIAEPRTLIALENTGTFIGVVKEDGTFDIQIDQTFKPNTWLYLDFITPGDDSKTFRISVLVIPRDPKVSPLKDTDRIVTGTAEPGSIVTVSTNTKVIGTGTTKKDGTFAVHITPQLGGETLFIKVHIGGAGLNDQLATTTVKDTTAPVAPKITHAAPDPTNAYPVTLIKGTAEPLTQVTLTANGQIIAENKTVGTDGNFAFYVAPLPTGTQVTATVTDAAGNVSSPILFTVVNVDGPIAPTIDPLKDTDMKLTGQAEPNEMVAVKVGQRTLGSTQSDVNGQFSVSIPKQKGGTVLTVVVTDFFKKSNSAQVTVASTVAPAAPRVNPVTHTSTKVTGYTVAYAKINITLNDKSYSGQADKYGHFSVSIDPQTRGTVLFVTATDTWGNTSKPTKVTVL